MIHNLLADLRDPVAPGSTWGRFRDLPATEAAISISKWEKVQEHVLKLLNLRSDWDGEGAPPIRHDLIRSALRLTEQLMGERDDAPQDVYPLPDGSIILEWQHRGGVIERIEIEEVGHGELMTTYPDASAEFAEVTWPPRAPEGGEAAGIPDEAAGKTSLASLCERDEYADVSEYDSFQLAA